jgi:hypothetical protein
MESNRALGQGPLAGRVVDTVDVTVEVEAGAVVVATDDPLPDGAIVDAAGTDVVVVAPGRVVVVVVVGVVVLLGTVVAVVVATGGLLLGTVRTVVVGARSGTTVVEGLYDDPLPVFAVHELGTRL